MQKLFKIVILLGLVFTSLIVLVAIVNSKFWVRNPQGGITTTKNISIEYWGTSIPEEIMSKLIAEYSKTTPNVKITYYKKSFNSQQEYRNYVADALRTGKAPDIMRIHSSWIPYISSRMSLTSEVFSEEEFKDTFYNPFKSSCFTQDDKVRCIPLSYDGLVLVYNKSMFANQGMVAPVTWEDVRDSAKRLTVKDERGNLLVAGVALGTTNNIDNVVDIVSLMLLQSEVKFPDNLDTEQAVRTIAYYNNFSDIDGVWSSDMPEAVTAFATEKVGMALVKSYQLAEILRINPTINIGVTKAPQLPKVGGTTTSKYVSSSWVEMVNEGSSSDVKKASWEFLEWLSRGENQLALYNYMSEVNPFGEVYANKKVKDQLVNAPLLGAFALTADQSTIISYASDSGNDDWNGIFIKLIDSVSTNNGGQAKYDDLKLLKDSLIQSMKKGY